jgi:hypothetical protein
VEEFEKFHPPAAQFERIAEDLEQESLYLYLLYFEAFSTVLFLARSRSDE